MNVLSVVAIRRAGMDRRTRSKRGWRPRQAARPALGGIEPGPCQRRLKTDPVSSEGGQFSTAVDSPRLSTISTAGRYHRTDGISHDACAADRLPPTLRRVRLGPHFTSTIRFGESNVEGPVPARTSTRWSLSGGEKGLPWIRRLGNPPLQAP